MEESLSKRERKKLARQEARTNEEQKSQSGNLKKWATALIIVGIVGYGIYWVNNELTKPLPGQTVELQGESHVADISDITYNTNPPTSGTHFPVWAKRGVYDRVISDGHLIHSLEHGYINISYNCEKEVANFSFPSSVSAHETDEPHEEPLETSTGSAEPLMRMVVGLSGEMSAFTPENPPPSEVELSEAFDSQECRDLVDKLAGFLDDWERVIVVPRPNLDTLIALTAWGKIDKLDRFDEKRIENFISTYHNQGPEKTQE